ncbi:MAG: rod shape-determining protein MreD [Spirochaetes bacterium]|nr:rod shape-determining protein MreD [Spirochaetota bacterium]
MIKKSLQYIILIFLILFQTSNFVDTLKIGNVKPDFVLTFIVFRSLTSTFVNAESLGFFCGIIIDIISHTLLGINSFTMTAISAVLNLFKTKIFVEKPFSVFIITFLSSITYRLLQVLLTVIFVHKINFYKSIIRISLPEAFYTAIAAMLLFPIYNKIFTKSR